jgi:hypothetical protein
MLKQFPGFVRFMQFNGVEDENLLIVNISINFQIRQLHILNMLFFQKTAIFSDKEK